jgi:hypothetical protein
MKWKGLPTPVFGGSFGTPAVICGWGPLEDSSEAGKPLGTGDFSDAERWAKPPFTGSLRTQTARYGSVCFKPQMDWFTTTREPARR